jgi:phage terminase small subunit
MNKHAVAHNDDRSYGELGPALRALNEQQRNFVRHYVAEAMIKPYGAATRAAHAAGYSDKRVNGVQRLTSKMAYTLLHDKTRSPKIVAAIAEETQRITRMGAPEAVGALYKIVHDPLHPGHLKALDMILSRTDPVVSRQDIAVTHRVVDPDVEALEELRALRKVGATREKLLELYGANGLDRIEELEARENAVRAITAKTIEGEAAG